MVFLNAQNMAAGIIEDGNFYERVLNRCTNRLVEDLDVNTILDYALQKEFFTTVEYRDIKDEKNTSDKIRKLIDKVKQKKIEGYKKFKNLLRYARQEHLATYLKAQEDTLRKEIISNARAKETRVIPQVSNVDKVASETDLCRISECIGKNWEMLGPFLLKNKSRITLDQIKEDHRTCQQRVYNLLQMWLQQTNNQSLAHLFHLMHKAGTSVTIDWNEIADALNINIREIRACKTVYRHPVQEIEHQQKSGTRNEYGNDPVHDPVQETPKHRFEDSKRNQVYSCIFDGRMMKLDNNQTETLESSLDKKAIGEGGIGIVYRCNNYEIFGIPVAVKKVETKGNANIERQVRREKISSRLMNPFILPLLAVVQKTENECWFISPFCENGDLHTKIENGRAGTADKISQAKRVKILIQIGLAIQYIHTGVPKVRGPILHKDIASKNVVLDENLNARLIDFGLAREMNDNSTTYGGRICYQPMNVGDGSRAKEHNDYFSFGIIIREMLTSLGPEGEKNLFLKRMDQVQIEQRVDKNVWKNKDISKKLNEISYNCLTEVEWAVADFEKKVVKPLRDIMEAVLDQEIFDNQGEQRCHQCIINSAVPTENSSLTNNFRSCRKRIEVCMACEKNSFLNPIKCYCGANLACEIGSNWGALLIAGDDENPEAAAAMKRDILELEKVITSQAPRIIGISKSKVKSVVPGDKEIDACDQERPTWTTIQKHITDFSTDKQINTLLIYISCHGIKRKDKNSVKEGVFQLGKKSEFISLDDFQKELEKLHSIDRLILFLDCCFPPMVKFQSNRKFVQINSCDDEQMAVLKDESLFTKYVIQGLKSRSVKECSKECLICNSYWSTRTEYISVCKLFDYVNQHLLTTKKAPKPDWQVKSFWSNIAFFSDEVVEIEFSFNREHTTIPFGFLKNIDEVKEKILQEFKINRHVDEVKISKDTFRNDQTDADECETLEQVIEAWVQRFPLSVSLRNKDET